MVPFSEVVTLSGPGNSAETTAADAILPRICEMKTKTARCQLTAPIKAMPSVTAGLKRPISPCQPLLEELYGVSVFLPPLILKKTHALTAKLKPNAREMYKSTLVLGTWVKLLFAVSAGAAAALAT